MIYILLNIYLLAFLYFKTINFFYKLTIFELKIVKTTLHLFPLNYVKRN